MGKIKTLSTLKKIVSDLQKKGKRIVFTNGCFDILHPGHLKLLQEAKQKGDILIVGLNSDSSVKKIKGLQRPIFSQHWRAQLLQHIDIVDYIVIFKEITPYAVIKTIQPNILVKGQDWKKKDIVGSNLVEQVYRVRLKSNYSTTTIINKIKQTC